MTNMGEIACVVVSAFALIVMSVIAVKVWWTIDTMESLVSEARLFRYFDKFEKKMAVEDPEGFREYMTEQVEAWNRLLRGEFIMKVNDD